MKKVRLQRNLVTRKTKLLSPFIKRYRQRVAISEVPEPMRSILLVTIQSDDGKLVFVKNPKAACTTVANVIYHYSKGHAHGGRIHRERENFRQGIEHFQENQLALNSSENTKFTFVRHPESRTVSAFHFFFVDQKRGAARQRFAQKRVKAMKGFGFGAGNEIGRNFDIYLDYLKASFEVDLQRTDEHFRLQKLNIGLGHVNYDLIGRVENFEKDLGQVFVLAGAGQYLDNHPGFGRHNTTNDSSLDVSRQQRKKIEQLYAPDYEAFNYH